jgi:uncharacterized protein RhaS with RHS repeats
MTGRRLQLVLGLLLWLAASGTGWCFYNPTTGRWLTRDPLGEDGGVNPYFMVKNDPPDIVDILGLDYSEDIVTGNPGGLLQAYTGEAGTKALARPHPIPSKPHVIISKGACCAAVAWAQQVDVNVQTILPRELDPQNWSSNALREMAGHEARRRTAYRYAYDAYIAPIQGLGGKATKCGTICGPNAEGGLRQYLDDYQRIGISAFNRWTRHQQKRIEIENGKWVRVEKLLDHYDWTYPLPMPPPLVDLPCPTGGSH